MNGTVGVSSLVATTATLSDHASVWMSGALKLSSEITFGSTGSGSCAGFRATDVYSSHSSV